MEITKEMLIEEIKVLKRASDLHARYSISQYKQVLKTLSELEKEKEFLEKKVKQRTRHLEEEIKQKENLANRLEKIAKYDQLTGLANRYLFLKELKLVQKEANLLNKTFALFFIDIDGFKFINDTYGHDVGDELLQTIASRIKSLVRSEDLVARLGGDEFTVILKNISDRDKIKEIALKIINRIKEVVKIDDISVYVGSSIGIYLYDNDDNFQDIVSKADIAMYEAKKTKGTYLFFDQSMQQELQKITTIKTKIKNALKNGQFINFFQPIVSSIDYKIRGVEVLLRWKNGDEFISPAHFMSVLEDDINLIKEVTFWQIEHVIKLLQKSDIYYSINLSVKLLSNSEIVEKLKDFIDSYDFDTSRIHFEVTETSLSTNLAQTSKILLDIKNFGFNISLDDFGTGYSSLAYLRELPFDTLKIDKKFIDNIRYSQKDKKILLAVINMAQILDMKVVLEGIETEEQLKILEHNNHIKYQGFYFYKPMEWEQLIDILNY